MTQLEKLYKSIQNLKELGFQLPEKTLNEINRVEEEIIQNEIIPKLVETINPVIEQIQREIILVVKHIPGEQLSIWLTRERSMTMPFGQSFPTDTKKKKLGEKKITQSKSLKKFLRVTFPDGRIISHKLSCDTLMETIEIVGIDKVRALNKVCRGVLLISDTEDDFYVLHEFSKEKGIYLMTNSSTDEKKEQLEDISKKLELGLKIEIV